MIELTPFDENIKINPPKLVDMCGYELPTNLQSFDTKRTNQSKNSVKSRLLYFASPCIKIK